MPIFFLGVDLIVFPALFFSNFKPPPPPHKGSAVFLNIGLTQTCIAIAVPHPPTWEPYQSTKRTTRKCETKSLEQGVWVSNLAKNWVYGIWKMGFKIAWNAFSERGSTPHPPLILSPRLGLAPLGSSIWLSVPPPPPPTKDSAVFLKIGLTQTCIAIAVPPHPHTHTWEPYQSTKWMTRKCKTNSLEQGVKVSNLTKNLGYRIWKKGLQNGLKCILREGVHPPQFLCVPLGSSLSPPLIATVLLSTHNMCYGWEIRQLITWYTKS